MLTQRVNRTDAEKVFVVVHNTEASSLTTGYGARYVGGADTETASDDGISVVMTTAGIASDLNFAGIAAQDTVADGYGLVQCWGYVDSIAYSFEADKTVGTEDFAIGGSILRQGSLAGTFTSERPAQFAGISTSIVEAVAISRYVMAWDTVNISGGVPYGPGFVRAL